MTSFSLMRRRDVLAGLSALSMVGGALSARAAQQAPPLSDTGQTVWNAVRDQAMQLAKADYAPPRGLPPQFPNLNYDAYRAINYRADQALWRDLGGAFQVQMFHRGGYFRDQVEIFEVNGQSVQPVLYSADQFSFGANKPPLESPDPALGFAGFRIHTPLNVPARFDELVAFLGASYFRAVAKGGVYGMSARGLALHSGDENEEFPLFRRFYLERPAADATSVAVCALLDSHSTSGAFRFVITPDTTTRIDVMMSLFPRVPLEAAGIAPLTSMYLFGDEQPRRFDDFRPQVHDCDGLLLADAMGRRAWRPLTNPRSEQISDFTGRGAGGFGLIQRQRGFETYQDLETDYQARPGVWVQPVSGFDKGFVRLVELSTRLETDDNIGAAWRTVDPLAAGIEHGFQYSLVWGGDPAPPAPLAKLVKWSDGLGDRFVSTASTHNRRFVLDFAPLAAADLEGVKAEVNAGPGSIRNVIVQPNAHVGGARLSFEFDPGDATVSELSAALVQNGTRVSEEWVHRWLT
jgi:glucans biosynthesis protein